MGKRKPNTYLPLHHSNKYQPLLITMYRHFVRPHGFQHCEN